MIKGPCLLHNTKDHTHTGTNDKKVQAKKIQPESYCYKCVTQIFIKSD